MCPSGKYADTPGSTSCQLCPEGTYIEDDGVEWKLHTLFALCLPCPVGRASDVQGAATCAACPEGQFSDLLGSLECLDCWDGVASVPGSATCVPCSAGQGPNANLTRCNDCPGGTFSDFGYGCYQCWPGSTSTNGSATCEMCAAGRCVSPDQTECIDCPAGRSTHDGEYTCWSCPRGRASSNGSTCEVCGAGRYALAESSSCLPCDAGFYSWDESYQCTECPHGSASSEGSAECTECAAGTIASASRAECLNCTAGKYRNSWDYDCLVCGWGTFSAEGSSACSSCPIGRSALTDHSACQDCPKGRYASGGSQDCYECWDGTAPAANQATCVRCAPGSFAGHGALSCTDCPPGRYQDRYGRTTCNLCPVGRYSNETGLNASSLCSECPGNQTQADGALSLDACIWPSTNQSFQCVAGKPCTLSGFQGTGLLDTAVHAVTVKHSTCASSQDAVHDLLQMLSGSAYSSFGEYGGSFAGFYGGYGRRLDSAGAEVAGFATAGVVWISTNFSVSWPGTVQAEPGHYELCWCGGFGFQGASTDPMTRCQYPEMFDVEAGVVTVVGLYPNQIFSCVRGTVCNVIGPMEGIGLTGQDQLYVRQACSLDAARFFGVELTVSVRPGNMTGQLDIYFGVNYTAWDPPGEYRLCWCSSQGDSCTAMDLSSFSDSSLYLESEAGTLQIEGPLTNHEAECFLGQYCTATLTLGGVNLKAGDRLTFLASCGDADFLAGLPSPGFAESADGLLFEFGSEPLSTAPGIFRMCWCRPSTTTPCATAKDFGTSIGLFLATGPYSGQSLVCQLGTTCVASGLRGVSLSPQDALLPMASCGAALAAAFPQPEPLMAVLNSTTGLYDFNFGQLQLRGGGPELIELCWCSSRATCNANEDYRAVAMELYVVCPAGWYELEGAVATCNECPPGYYCPGGWKTPLSSCPAGSTSPQGAREKSECQCRRGYYYDEHVAVCLSCPAGSFKDSVGNSAECDGICPEGTSSDVGASRLSQCKCTGETVDIDSGESLLCAELVSLSANFSSNSTGNAGIFATREAAIFSFSGSLQVQDASTPELLAEIRTGLASRVDLATENQVSLAVRVRFHDGWYADFEIQAFEDEKSIEIHAKLEPASFAAWVFTRQVGAALSRANVTNVTEVQASLLQCPDGLGLRAGWFVSSLADCRCPHGLQPSVDGMPGLVVGCTVCPAGRYKSSVEDAACGACPASDIPLTTLQKGAISYAACTCSAGYVNNEPDDPAACERCGSGFYCEGGAHKEACGESQTTMTDTAGSTADCLCAAGSYLNTGLCQSCLPGRFKANASNDPCVPCPAGSYSEAGQRQCAICEPGSFSTGDAGSCELCPLGRYSEVPSATSLSACLQCPLGTWNNETGAASQDHCQACPAGSTTSVTGAENLTFCVRPDPDQARSCVSGRPCAISGITGTELRAGHRIAIVGQGCDAAKVATSGIIDGGISDPAEGHGSQYAWGKALRDFVPPGGQYNLCWCASMGALHCDDLNFNFVTFVGHLFITGPLENSFECVRGRDCTGLAPVAGFDLSALDLVAVRRDACGLAAPTEISGSNAAGIGSLTQLDSMPSTLALGFGVSDEKNSFYLTIDAEDTGYLLCWCAVGRGLEDACISPDQFNAYAGRLRIVGPRKNQESGCSVGQPCSISGIQGAGMEAGDRIMVLSDCGRGNALPGFPSSGILETSNVVDFNFLGNESDVLLSVPGIFRLCFCRPWPAEGTACNTPQSFRAKVGLLTASGPFEQAATCILGSNCTLQLSGIGLQAGDRLMIADESCGQAGGMSLRGFPDLNESVSVTAGNGGTMGLEASLGKLPEGAMPGQYRICWCPESAECGDALAFRAPGGTLRVDCPPGSFAIGPVSGPGSRGAENST